MKFNQNNQDNLNNFVSELFLSLDNNELFKFLNELDSDATLRNKPKTAQEQLKTIKDSYRKTEKPTENKLNFATMQPMDILKILDRLHHNVNKAMLDITAFYKKANNEITNDGLLRLLHGYMEKFEDAQDEFSMYDEAIIDIMDKFDELKTKDDENELKIKKEKIMKEVEKIDNIIANLKAQKELIKKNNEFGFSLSSNEIEKIDNDIRELIKYKSEITKVL